MNNQNQSVQNEFEESMRKPVEDEKKLKGASNNLNFIAISSMCSLESHSF